MCEVRLQKAVARAGLCSRREAEQAIVAGRIAINGRVVQVLGTKVDPARDRLSLDGRPVSPAPSEMWVVNKPPGLVAMPAWPEQRRSARSLVPTATRLFSVGRLDAACAGLTLYTNDGDLAAGLLAAGPEEVTDLQVAGRPDAADLRRLRRGLRCDGRTLPPLSVELLGAGARGGWWLRVRAPTAHARSVRRALALVGHPAGARVRVAYGPLGLGELPEGGARRLTAEERAALATYADGGPGRRNGRARGGAPAPVPTPVTAPGRRPERRERPRSIALDGPVASGKTAAGRRLAAALGYLMVDTGLLYRCLAWLAVREGVPIDDGAALAALVARHGVEVVPAGGTPAARAGDCAVHADGRAVGAELATAAVDRAVSPVSAQPLVRAALLAPQRRIAAAQPVVMAGRDIGTVVLPDADLKLFLTASAATRARRRFRERLASGETARYAEILSALEARDAYDSGRAVAPLVPAPDAVVVDTDACDLTAVVAHLLALVERWPDPPATGGGASPCSPARPAASG